MRRLLLTAVLVALALPALAGSPDLSFPDATRDQWHGHERHRFRFEGADAWVVVPERALAGNPWSWCLIFPDAFTERCAAPQLVSRGFHHAFLDVGNTFGAPAALATLGRFHDELVRRGLAAKPALVGISRGGLFAHRYAAEHPGRVAAIYGDAAVCDARSWPGGRAVGRAGKGSPTDWLSFKRLYGFADDAAALAWTGNPVDTLAPLARAGVALIHVVGDADDVVPPAENGLVVAERYKALGGTIELIRKPGVGHHPHGLDAPAPIVEFLVRHAGAPAAAAPTP